MKKLSDLLDRLFPTRKGRRKFDEMMRKLEVDCDINTVVSIFRGHKPPQRSSRIERHQFLRRIATDDLTVDEVRKELLSAMAWWNKGVATSANLYKTFESARGDLKDSVALFTSNGVGFDERGKSAVNVLFAIVAAGAFVTSLSIPLLLDDKKRFVGGFVLVFASIVFLANAIWSRHANGILRAYYCFYVASIIDSARKHAAFGASPHAWHEYVLVQLRRCPRNQNELIEFWTQGKTTLYHYYSRWISIVAVLCFGLSIFAVVCGTLVLYRNSFAMKFFLPSSTTSVAPGDELTIESPNDPTINRRVTVLSNGTIKLPHAGHVYVAGQTIDNIEQTLTTAYAPHFAHLSVTSQGPPVQGPLRIQVYRADSSQPIRDK